MDISEQQAVHTGPLVLIYRMIVISAFQHPLHWLSSFFFPCSSLLVSSYPISFFFYSSFSSFWHPLQPRQPRHPHHLRHPLDTPLLHPWNTLLRPLTLCYTPVTPFHTLLHPVKILIHPVTRCFSPDTPSVTTLHPCFTQLHPCCTFLNLICFTSYTPHPCHPVNPLLWSWYTLWRAVTPPVTLLHPCFTLLGPSFTQLHPCSPILAHLLHPSLIPVTPVTPQDYFLTPPLLGPTKI